ncbi:MAG: hypothetical protein F4X99_03640 [Gammaproteobacteria bacterium]|nr:hypothetical protein [Gammaproteobacteria bacterium]
MDRDTRSRIIAELHARVLGEDTPERETARRVRSRSESLDDLRELSNATLRSYRKKAGTDREINARWVYRGLAKSKMRGKGYHPEAPKATRAKVGSTEREIEQRRQGRKWVRRTRAQLDAARKTST